LLGLGSAARMNLPGTGTGNWTWRMKPGALTLAIEKRLATLTKIFDRSPIPPDAPKAPVTRIVAEKAAK